MAASMISSVNALSGAKVQARTQRAGAARTSVVVSASEKPVVIGLAADSGCGKSTFMRRITSIFGGSPQPPAGGNPDSNTLLSDMTTVICLDDYHSLDRFGRKEKNVTALAPEAQNFELMAEQVPPLCPRLDFVSARRSP
jgi:phosphoribulokinase